MQNYNSFQKKNLKNIVFIGYSPNFKKLFENNLKIGLESFFITTTNQSKSLDIKNYKIFDELNQNFKDYIVNKFNFDNTIFLSISTMHVFKKDLIEFFGGNLINFHPSRLPYDAGRGGFSWNIIRGDRIYSQSVHLVDEVIDNGPIIFSNKCLFPSHCKIPLDYENFKLSKMEVFLKDFFLKLKNGENFQLKYQNSDLRRYNPALNTEINGVINWFYEPLELFNFINAFDDPFKGASTYVTRKNLGKLYIKKIHLHSGDSPNHEFMTGLISRHDGEWITVCTRGRFMLLIEEVKNNDGKNIINLLKEGDRFFNNSIDVDNSLNKRIFYK